MFIEIPENRRCSIKLTFKRARPCSNYIRILKLCSDSPKTLQQIYPNAGYSAIADEVVALTKQGYLSKFTTPKHVKMHQTPSGIIYNTYTKVWYGTTYAGHRLVERVCK